MKKSIKIEKIKVLRIVFVKNGIANVKHKSND